MALTKTMLIKEQSIRPIEDLEILELPPIVKDAPTGKFVFLFDYETKLTLPDLSGLIGKDGNAYPIPKNTSYTVRYSKGDVVKVISVGNLLEKGNVYVPNYNDLILNVPKYVNPIGYGINLFPPTINIDNTIKTLQRVADNTPLTLRLGTNFGKNPNPATPVKLQPLDPPTPTGTTTTPVVTNGVQDTTETKSFFDDKNNLIMVGVVLLVGYLLLDNKSE
jgi:hypothetical protein